MFTLNAKILTTPLHLQSLPLIMQNNTGSHCLNVSLQNQVANSQAHGVSGSVFQDAYGSCGLLAIRLRESQKETLSKLSVS